MSKFWYQLVNKKANLTVKLAEKSTLVFSERLIGTTEHFVEENTYLDNLVKSGELRKLSDSEKKNVGKASQAVAKLEAKPEAKPEVKPEAKPEAKPAFAPSDEASVTETGDEEKDSDSSKSGKKKGKK